MPKITIKGRMVDVDIRAELERFAWHRARWTGNKLIAASPFRYDRTPSFFVNIDGQYAGTWVDSGAYDVEWRAGGFVKLLAFLRNETEDETADYLLTTYAAPISLDNLTLQIPKLTIEREREALDDGVMARFVEDYAYLESRGISADVQRQMGVRFDAARQAVVIPWRDAMGRLTNVKYRSVRGKTFWYERGGVPVRRLVYGIDTVFAERAKVAAICEAEIDALSWRQIGVPGLAVGGVNFTSEQADIIKRSPIERLYVATDNDKAGRKLRDEVIRELRGFIELFVVEFAGGLKDSNEVLFREGESALRKALDRAEQMSGLSTLFHVPNLT